MQVTVGWATEYARHKVAVTLEEPDLERILADAGMAEVLGKLTAVEAFGILDAEANRYVIFTMREMKELTGEDAAARLKHWQGVLGERLAAVRKRLGVISAA